MSKHYWVHSDPTVEEEPAGEVPPGLACVGYHPDHPVRRDSGRGRLCDDCYEQLCRHLTELPGVVAWLHVNLAATGSALGEKVSGSRQAPTPLRLDVLDMIGPTNSDNIDDTGGLEHIPSTLQSWAVTVAEWRPTALPASLDVHTLCRWFQRDQLTWIVAQDWVDDFLTQLHRLVRQASGVAPWRAEMLRDRQEPCGKCGVLALVQHVAEGRVVCEERLGGCGRGRKVTEYEWRTRHLRTDPKRQEAAS